MLKEYGLVDTVVFEPAMVDYPARSPKKVKSKLTQRVPADVIYPEGPEDGGPAELDDGSTGTCCLTRYSI
jgi:hypothetical protein